MPRTKKISSQQGEGFVDDLKLFGKNLAKEIVPDVNKPSLTIRKLSKALEMAAAANPELTPLVLGTTGISRGLEMAGHGKKRAPTAYNLFMKAEMAKQKKKHPGMKQSEIMKLAAAAYRKKHKKTKKKKI